MPDLYHYLQQLLNGLTIGSTYALIAIGYTMVYGVLKLINFAHGDLFTIGAYLGLTLLTSLALTDHVGGFLGIGLLALMVMGVLLIWRHRENIRRLLAGTESKLGSKKK